jgi:hypothetical protein
MNLGKQTYKNSSVKVRNFLNKVSDKAVSKSKINNMSLISVVGVTTIACNVSQDDQCYGGLGVIAGSFCASQNDIIVNPTVALKQITSSESYELTAATDALEFKNSNNITGSKYTLTDGDILVNPGVVSLNLINSGSIDGQKITGAAEIQLMTQGTTVILTTDWYNNELVTIKNSDQSVTLNDLQASNLDSAKAEDSFFYPGTDYKIENVNIPNQSIFFNFNESAILGTSTEVNLFISDSLAGIEGGVFTDPSSDAVETPLEVDPFAVDTDTNIEKLNLTISDTNLA